jgi:NAD(P)-dependent dehydrogenase (short-subunit alcohol dehydrogenase family)
MSKTALIVGAGSGISAAFARLLHGNDYRLILAARGIGDLSELCAETNAQAVACDATDQAQVDALFAAADRELGALDVVLYNASYRTRGPVAELDPEEVRKSLLVSAFGGFLVAQAAARRMLKQGKGAILFTGASASVKGYVQSAPFAMGKFALRGLAQSMARELHPKGVHVAHFIIDGGVRDVARGRMEKPSDPPDSMLDPEAIAESYLAIVNQPRSTWSWEIELRPWVEKF